METLDLIYDHYKDTFTIITKQIKQRNKKFVFIFIIAFVFLLFTFNPDGYGNLIFGYIKEQYSIDLTGYFSVIQTFLWVILLYETLRYSQSIIYIEREYQYIASLEEKISQIISYTINRESQDYSDNYSVITNYSNIIYKYLFPSFSIIVVTLKIISEYKTLNIWCFLIIDTLLYIAYILLWFFHSYYVIKNDK